MALFRSILITGTNRGIGLEMVKQLSARADCPIIFATCRDPSKATVSILDVMIQFVNLQLL